MGKEGTLIGTTGEYLFGFLAGQHWKALFTRTPSAEGTDGYLEWGDLRGIRLWVQVKTHQKIEETKSYLTERIENDATLRQWAAYGPILVVCILDEGRAWWLDTTTELSGCIKKAPYVFRIPLSQLVNSKTKEDIRILALGRPRNLPFFVYPSIHNSYNSRFLYSNYSIKRPLESSDIKKIVKSAYQDMYRGSVLDRDITALAIARLIYLHTPFQSNDLEYFIETVLKRILTTEWGGRSFTLGTLAFLLQPQFTNKFGSEFISGLTKASAQVIEEKTAISPEFGLLIAASLAQRFPERSDLLDFLESLINLSLTNPQNIQIEKTGYRLRRWMNNRQIPLGRLFPSDWITEQVVRPLKQDAEIFVNFEMAEDRANQLIKTKIIDVEADDINLVDQLIRFKALEKISEWL